MYPQVYSVIKQKENGYLLFTFHITKFCLSRALNMQKDNNIWIILNLSLLRRKF